ncbi:MAG: hypothetical protein GF405_04145 [Candidatus Eisenbacteria bacterium]|nr:hypothetical protein [Candidatus Eisenbacteria bacterium]
MRECGGCARDVSLRLAALMLAGILMLAGCGGDEAHDEVAKWSPPRVVLIGVDGLDWDRVDAMISEGRLPNIARLRDRGSSGVLRSIPPFLSPSVWTSMATGKSQEKHGISGFLVGQGRTKDATPTSGNMRRVRAFWEVLSAADLSVGVVAWLVTWPAEPVNGYMVSPNINRLLSWRSQAKNPAEADERLAMAVYPPEYTETVVDCRVTADDVPQELLHGLLETTEHLDDPDVALDYRNLAATLANDLTVLAIADSLAELQPTSVRALYLRGLDVNCHAMWKYMDPSSWRGDVPPKMERTFSSVIERYHVLADSMVGAVVESAGEDALFILCSDHGFAGHRGYDGFEGDVAIGIDMHREDGLLVMAGPGIRRGETISGASVLDITPTLLTAVGLPAARDMDGRVLVEAFDQDFLARHPVSLIDSYETGDRATGEEPIESPVDDEIRERLRSLGYIE